MLQAHGFDLVTFPRKSIGDFFVLAALWRNFLKIGVAWQDFLKPLFPTKI